MSEIQSESKLPRSYPVCALEPSYLNESPDQAITEEVRIARFEKMLYDPSFKYTKRFLLAKPELEFLEPKHRVKASPLITWTRDTSGQVDAHMKAVKDSLDPRITTSVQPLFNYISHCITLVDGTVLSKDVIQAKKTPFPNQPYPYAPVMSHVTLCKVISIIYYEYVSYVPGKVIRIPLPEIRVRDVIMYRFFRDMLADADMLGSIKVRTDTLQRPDNKEIISEPLYTTCAWCRKVDLTHQRCSKCMVAFYCSAEHQTKDWSIHKSECKERQKEQKEWDAMVAEFA